MNCKDIQQRVDDYMDGYLQPAEYQIFRQHIDLCSGCKQALDEARELHARLKALPVPDASPGFAARALANARQAQRPRWQGQAIAATALVLALTLGIVIGRLPGDPGQGLPAVQLALNETQTVNLVFNSPQAFEHTTFMLDLPEGIQLAGYPEQRQLNWEGSLKQGRNLLALPVVAVTGEGGDIVARIQHGNVTKVFKLRLDVKSGELSQQLQRVLTV